LRYVVKAVSEDKICDRFEKINAKLGKIFTYNEAEIG
jgi:hypothetical protein